MDVPRELHGPNKDPWMKAKLHITLEYTFPLKVTESSKDWGEDEWRFFLEEHTCLYNILGDILKNEDVDPLCNLCSGSEVNLLELIRDGK